MDRRCGTIQRMLESTASVVCGWVFWSLNMLLVKPLKWIFSILLGSSSFIVLELVKMAKSCQPGQTRMSARSDVDSGIYQLLHFYILREQVQKLNLEADRCEEETRDLLRRGKKSQALRRFRGCKRLKKRADSLLVKLKTIQRILDQLAQSQTDKMVLQAYQAVVHAENLMHQIQEDEVNQIAADEDMDDLEEELMALLDETNVD